MRKKTGIRSHAAGRRGQLLALAGALTIMTAAVSGCQMKKYEKLDLPGMQTGSETAGGDEAGGVSEAGRGQTDDSPGAAGGQSEGSVGNGGSAQDSPEAERSAVKAEITTETAPEMEARDETVYVNATNVNMRTAPNTKAQSVARLNPGDEFKRTGLGDKVSDHSAAALNKLGNGLADRVAMFFGLHKK